MYCPDCGDHATQGLNYCKQCGTALTSLESKGDVEARSRPATFKWVLALLAALIGLGGLAGILGMGFVLAQNPAVSKEFPIALVMVGSLSFVFIFMMLVFMVLRLSGASPDISTKKTARPKPRRGDAPPQVEAPPASLSSVTEHTTRTFEPRRRESNALD